MSKNYEAMKNHKLFINEIVGSPGSPGTSKGLLVVSGRGSDRQRPWKSQLRRGAGGGKAPGHGLRVPPQAAPGAPGGNRHGIAMENSHSAWCFGT